MLVVAYTVMYRIDKENINWVVWILVASWIGEATSIHFYHFYQYPNHWWFRIAGVPLLIPLIWPLVILTGRKVIQALWPNARHLEPILVGAIIFFDASMVEVAAVRCGLWYWNETGYLGVPLIGVLGWAIFGALSTMYIKKANPKSRWKLIFFAPVALHISLLAGWWGIFRWVLRGDWFYFYLMGIGVATVAVAAVRNKRRIPFPVAAIRILAAVVFVGLVAIKAPFALRVWLHIALLVLPYLLVTGFQMKTFGGNPSKSQNHVPTK